MWPSSGPSQKTYGNRGGANSLKNRFVPTWGEQSRSLSFQKLVSGKEGGGPFVSSDAVAVTVTGDLSTSGGSIELGSNNLAGLGRFIGMFAASRSGNREKRLLFDRVPGKRTCRENV